jgi:hypothetical protein
MEEDSCEGFQGVGGAENQTNFTPEDDARIRAIIQAQLDKRKFFEEHILSRTNWRTGRGIVVGNGQLPGTPSQEILNVWRHCESEIKCVRGCIEACKCHPGSVW